MAFPTILINSATGSDSAASGAGPATALTGTGASTSANGLVVTLDANTDLTNVLTDGSHVIYLADGASGNRNFGKITAKAGSGGATPTVTVSDAFGANGNGLSWAIGGVRQKLLSTTSGKLLNNNDSAGDAKGGWVLQMQSGHAESWAGYNTILGGGAHFILPNSDTNGPVTIQGDPAAATMPVLTNTANNYGLIVSGGSSVFANFEMRNTNGTKTTGAHLEIGVNTGAGWTAATCRNLKMNHAVNSANCGILIYNAGAVIRDCEIAHMTQNAIGTGVEGSGTNGTQAASQIFNNWIHDNGGSGYWAAPAQTTNGCNISGNIFANNGVDGITYQTEGVSGFYLNDTIVGNTCDNNAGSGINVTTNNIGASGMLVMNNICSNNGAYGLAFPNLTAGQCAQFLLQIVNNDFYGNASGAVNPTGIDSGSQTLAPGFANAPGGNYQIGTNLKAKGYPQSKIGTTSNTASYTDIGAAQRQEPASSGGGYY